MESHVGAMLDVNWINVVQLRTALIQRHVPAEIAFNDCLIEPEQLVEAV